MTHSKQQQRIRMMTLIGTIMAQFALGSVYTWSLFNSGLASKLHEPVNKVAFSFGLLSLALAVASSISGKLQDRFGVRNVTIAAAVLMGAGLMLTSISANLWSLYLFAGIILGLADGTGYLMTLSNCVKWFPERKGLISALSIGAYGLGSLGFKYINLFLLNHFHLAQTFQIWGMLCLAIILIGGLMMKDAPVAGNQSAKVASAAQSREFTLAESIVHPQFWMLALIFLTVCMSGLFVIGVAKDIGTNMVHLSLATATQSVAVIALANLLGRLILGVLSDKMARIRVVSIALVLSLFGIALLLFHTSGSMSFYLAIACIAFSFGGTITVFPSLVSDFFGMTNLTKNYGAIYLGFGIGSLAASMVSSLLGGFVPTFYLILVLLAISLVISLMVRQPGTVQNKGFEHQGLFAQQSH
ncbi:L-lactate MFS transporter [Celerinatantimonas diazotrophica]|uniref:OFA family oxalate/formate antiporter-like MFS transporter n=1 Tax=Celerinatantimonas diazotrophica TaxID=412034 RepID=A0A4R1J8S7_9GAMM|nr:OFA family MFS transporter [Celerinatantimonas diazotrophica]TCK46966.1 OFA family oxalate/formate antiporter-like MFS transporter [Celerinatantimonas diazotrophica]CAG9295734.1 putative MFS-type transporter YhjX [Celerinatantimonas diazotrophica]